MQLRRDDLVVRHLDGEVVMLCLATSTYFSANASGSLLVDLLGEEHDEQDLAVRLADEVGIPLIRAQSDVRTFVGQLRAHGLLVD